MMINKYLKAATITAALLVTTTGAQAHNVDMFGGTHSLWTSDEPTPTEKAARDLRLEEDRLERIADRKERKNARNRANRQALIDAAAPHAHPKTDAASEKAAAKAEAAAAKAAAKAEAAAAKAAAKAAKAAAAADAKRKKAP